MIVDHLARMASAQSITEAWKLHLEAMAGHGFSRLLYVSTRFRTKTSLGDLQDALFLTNHPREHACLMIERGLIRHASMMGASAGAHLWAPPPKPAATEGTLTGLVALVTEARIRSGLVAGVDVVFHEVSTRAWGAIELCAQPGLAQEDVNALWAERGAEIDFLCNLLHLKVSHLPSWGGRRPLTLQQHRVLRWVSEGKTADEIATIMGVTRATVEKHLRLAREALDVLTTAQAVSKAARWNQLFVEEPPALR